MSIRSMNDTDLVKLYISGNENALATLLERHQSRIFGSIVMVIKDRELAEDIFQETFYKAILTIKKGQYNEEGKFLPWIMRIARNLMIDHFRALKKMPTIPVFINDEGEEVSVFDCIKTEQNDISNYERSGVKKNIRTLINKLPADQREVVIMRTYYDMSFKEIAEYTNVSINTSLGRMRYALMNLKKMIEESKLEVVL